MSSVSSLIIFFYLTSTTTVKVILGSKKEISIPVKLHNDNGEIERFVFSYALSEEKYNLDYAVLRFCENHRVFRRFCLVLMEEALIKILELTSNRTAIIESDIPNAEGKNDRSVIAERVNKFRAEFTLHLFEEEEASEMEKERKIDMLIYETFLGSSSKSKPLVGDSVCFIHSCTLSSSSDSSILEEILQLLQSTQLLHSLRMIVVMNYGVAIRSLQQLQELYPTVLHIHRASDTNRFEIPTLRHIQHFARALHAKEADHVNILYLHTKGVSYKEEYRPVIDWRRMMLYFLVEKHETCLHLLASGDIDTLGCNLYINPSYYAGNMWWADSHYLAKLQELQWAGFKYQAEYWVLTGDRVRAYILHHSHTHHYEAEYPRERYAAASSTSPRLRRSAASTSYASAPLRSDEECIGECQTKNKTFNATAIAVLLSGSS